MASGINNDIEPPRKRVCCAVDREQQEEKEETSNDIVALLPAEIVTKIFLFLRNGDIFRKCTLVSKRWNAFIKSNQFCESVIIFEFGKQKASRFLSSNCVSCSSLFDQLRLGVSLDREINRRTFGGIKNGRYDVFLMELMLETQPIKECLKALTAEDRTEIECNEAACKNGFIVVNLSKMVRSPDKVFDTLKVPLAIRTRSRCSSPFYLLDNKFKLLGKLRRVKTGSDRVWLVCFGEYPCGVRYLATRDSDFHIRLLLPSDGRRISRRKISDSKFLIKASRSGDVPKIIEVLSSKNPEIEGFEGYRPLVEAAGNGHAEAVRILLESGAKIDQPGGLGFTPLETAVVGGHCECINLLLDHGGSFVPDPTGRPLVLLAVRGGHTDAIKLLLDRGADVNQKDSTGKNALHHLSSPSGEYFTGFCRIRGGISSPVPPILTYLVEGGCDVNALSEQGAGLAPLMLAAENCDLKMAEWLLDHGANVNLRSKSDKPMTALSMTVRSYKQGKAAMARLLIDRGAVLEENILDLLFVKVRGEGGKWDSELLQLLIERGANVKLPPHNEFQEPTLLLSLLSSGMVKEAKLLIKAGVDVNAANQNWETALMYASKLGDAETIDLLIEKGAEINARDKTGRTALMYATEASLPKENEATDFPWLSCKKPVASTVANAPVAEALLRHGADMTLKDNAGRTAMDCIKSNQNILNTCEVYAILFLHGKP